MELFADSSVFVYMFLTALAAALLWRLGALRKKSAVKNLFAGNNYQNLIPAELAFKRRAADGMFIAGAVMLFIALAAPQWGREKAVFYADYSQAVVAVDVSASMLAPDVKPSRLQSAKTMLSMLVENMVNERLGIIAFTSQAYLQSPITTDASALKALAGALQTDMLPVQGTALGPAVGLAVKMLENYPGRKAVVLITDGEDHSPQDIQSAINLARENNIKIIAVGIGSAEGELIAVKTADGTKSYKKDKEGKTVVTKLDEQVLMNLAQATGGVYIRYTTAQHSADEIARQLALLDKTSAQSSQTAAYKNRYQIPLFTGLVLLLCSILIPLRKVK